ncbi:sulfatase-like hydrolase/transferase [Arthrobacter castelli]|uniref:sulfatase-like hydrolase/transferase n=1 Tax=Arthrobacter castelli TaxID=271431 RepID=UPI0004101947|nr:sulfatase-like hydrolase/transferase [Arthrobacter castelli]
MSEDARPQAGHPTGVSNTQRKNMLMLMTDQHRVDTLGCYGSTICRTPNLDALAASGTRFDSWFTPTAICTPARASLFTGAAPFRHKLLANHERNVGYMEDLPDEQWTLPEELRANGYNCGLVGKWHVGENRTAADFGFDAEHYPGWHNPVDHPDYLRYLEEHGYPPYRITNQMRGTFPNGEKSNLLAARLQQPTEATFEHYLADRTIEMLTRYVDDIDATQAPFFLVSSFSGPHLPYIVPDEYFDMYHPADVVLPPSVAENFADKPPVQQNYSRHWAFDSMTEEESRKLIAVYWGYVTMIDEEFGRILRALDELGLADTTAVAFSSDHGEFTGSHRLHDKGPAMYDDIYRTGGIIRVPGCTPQVRDEFVTLQDLTATYLDLAGLNTEPAVDSRSLLPLVRGEDVAWDDHVVCEFHGHHFPIAQRMLRGRRYKLIVNPESVNEFYDLQTDPDELQNRNDDPLLTDTRNAMLADLYERLRARGDNFYHWMSSMYEIGDLDYDPTMSGLDESSYCVAATGDA